MLSDIELILDPKNKSAEVTLERASKYLYELSLPDIVNPNNPKSVTFTRDGTFESICMSLEGRGVHDPAGLNVYQFYKRIEILNEKK